MERETCAGSEYEDEYSADKKAYRAGKIAYGLPEGNPCPPYKDSRLSGMWYMGYNYMHAMESI